MHSREAFRTRSTHVPFVAAFCVSVDKLVPTIVSTCDTVPYSWYRRVMRSSHNHRLMQLRNKLYRGNPHMPNMCGTGVGDIICEGSAAVPAVLMW